MGVAVGGLGVGVGVGLHWGSFGLYMQYKKGLRVGVAAGGTGVAVGGTGVAVAAEPGVGVMPQRGQLIGSGSMHMSRRDSSDLSGSAMTVATRARKRTRAARTDSHLIATPFDVGRLMTPSPS